jgi:putative ABC transport system substrate-binding protein
MNRRYFIVLVSAGVAVLPLRTQAQQSNTVRRIGFIAHKHEGFYEPLFGRLRELGYEEGRNLIVERRYAKGNAARFQEFADEMVRQNVNVIIVVTTPVQPGQLMGVKRTPRDFSLALLDLLLR